MIYDLGTKIDKDFVRPSTQFEGRGKHCFIYNCPDNVKKAFGLEDKKLVLKVFSTIPVTKNTKYDSLKWGDDPKEGQPRRNTLFMQATKIQNIAHYHGLAPRVWALLLVEWNGKKYLTQLTDDIRGVVTNKQIGTYPKTKVVANFETEHVDAECVYNEVIKLGEAYGFGVHKRDVSKWDVVNGQLIDFQTFAFNAQYENILKTIFKEGTKWGKIYYQAIPGIGLNGGPRKMDVRINEMELDKIDFEGKTVLDLGCSGGAFINYALEHGAKRVIGLDFPQVIEGSRLASNQIENFNAEYYGVDLLNETTESIRKKTGVEKFDIVFYLSMFRHVHYPSFVWEMCKETAIIEWNNWKTEDEIKALVEKNFIINRMGRTTDHGTGKDYYICTPKE